MQTRTISWIVAVGFVSLLPLEPAIAGTVQFGSNYYSFVSVSDPFAGNNNSWFAASAAASASVFKGAPGHLATVTSQAENDFLVSLAPTYAEFAGAWIGGKAPEGWLAGPEAGQAFGYTNFGGFEPNNSGYVYVNIGAHPDIPHGKWVDDSGVQGVPDPVLDPVRGYFVEYEGSQIQPTAVPLPSAGLAGIVGLGSLTAYQFVRKAIGLPLRSA